MMDDPKVYMTFGEFLRAFTARNSIIWMIQGDIYLDRKAESVLQTPIGPFASKDDAELFLFKMRPLWGNQEVVPVLSPRMAADRAHRSGAANFLEE